MNHRLDFQVKHTYDSREIGITIEATLRRGSEYAVCDAKVDTGSEFCLFGREYAEELGIDVVTGFKQTFQTLTGAFVAYGHDVELETLGLKVETFVYFADDLAIKRNLLGRQGWLQLVTIGLDDYRSEIYVSPNQNIQ